MYIYCGLSISIESCSSSQSSNSFSSKALWNPEEEEVVEKVVVVMLLLEAVEAAGEAEEGPKRSSGEAKAMGSEDAVRGTSAKRSSKALSTWPFVGGGAEEWTWKGSEEDDVVEVVDFSFCSTTSSGAGAGLVSNSMVLASTTTGVVVVAAGERGDADD